MLTVSSAACAHFATLLDQANAPEGLSLRLVASESGIGIQPDTAREGDSVFEHEGRPVLVVDERLAEGLGEHTIDLETSDEGEQQLVITK